MFSVGQKIVKIRFRLFLGRKKRERKVPTATKPSEGGGVKALVAQPLEKDIFLLRLP